jgi:hypothetical protein
MTTLTAMKIFQKERNKNRHKPEEAHRHQQPHRHTKDRHPLVDKNKKLFGLFCTKSGHMESDYWTLKEKKGKMGATTSLHSLYKNRDPGK